MLGRGQEESISKGLEETLGDDRYFLSLNCGDGFTEGMHMPNTEVHIKKITEDSMFKKSINAVEYTRFGTRGQDMKWKGTW